MKTLCNNTFNPFIYDWEPVTVLRVKAAANPYIYAHSWNNEGADTDDDNWMDPLTWIIENYERFKKFLPPEIKRNQS